MFRKLLIAYLVLLAFALGTLGALFGQSVRKRVRDEIAQRLESHAEMLRPLVQAVPSSELQATVKELGGRVGSRLTVIGPDGVVMADSHANPSEMDNHNTRTEVQQARSEGRGRNVRHSDTVRYDMMYCASRLAENQPGGVILRAAFPLTQIQAEIRALYRGIVLAFFVTALVGVVVTYLAVRQITRPLSRIRAVAQAISAGD
ncbi:MAG: HAMP domain-containing protein, partial [Planctomycetes bacterium]|nr:HAMP domain-containing protein [Planctomycetota bacterium]